MSTRSPNTRPPCLRSGQGRGWKSHEPLDAALTGAAGVGELGGLARTKSFFQKTLRPPRGAFFRDLGRGGAGLERRCRVATPRPEDLHPWITSGAGSDPLPRGEGARRRLVKGRPVGWAGVVWRGCQEREGA